MFPVLGRKDPVLLIGVVCAIGQGASVERDWMFGRRGGSAGTQGQSREAAKSEGEESDGFHSSSWLDLIFWFSEGCGDKR